MHVSGDDIRVAIASETALELEGNLLAELRANSEQGENTQITLEIRGDDALHGGLTGSTSYGWLLIKVLWVAPQIRKLGYGRRLVERAIRQAREAGCHSVWLDTSDANALVFYKGLGFEEFGVLENGLGQRPENHSRFFMKRRISGPNENLT